MKLIKWAILILFLCGVAASDQKTDLYQRPLQVERSHDFDAIHYRLKLTFDLEQKRFWGENRVTLKPLKDGFRECFLDAMELKVTGILNDQNIPLIFKQTEGQLQINFLRSYNYGDKIIFTIKYSVNNPGKGFFFSEETDRNPNMISTDSWPDEARYWFPCYDYPHDKVTMELIATVKKPNKVLSNGKLISIKEHEQNSLVTYHWHQQKPHSTYLSMVAIGPFAVIKDSLGNLPINYWVYPKDLRDAKRIFRKTPDMIAFFNKIYDYPYPWAKYDQVETPTQGGGAEATSATILGQNVICDEKGEKDFSWQTIIAHEVAHQWWGDLITLRTWSETWMNESFATYSDYLYTRYDRGEEEGALALLNKKNAYLKEARERYIRPIVFNRYESPGQNFDSHTYPKGACVLHMLRFILGDTSFFKTLSCFLHKHAFQAVDTRDFMTAIKDTTGRNLDWFFDQYIFKPGHPVFEVIYKWKDKRVFLKVSQVQDLSKNIPVYKIPVNIGIKTRKNKTTHKVWISKKEQTFDFEVKDKPLLVRFDEGNHLLKEWTFKKDLNELIYQLKNDDVIGRIWAGSELVSHKMESPARKVLINSAVYDPFWAVRRNSIRALAKNNTTISNSFLRKICQDPNSRVRETAFGILGDKKDPKLIGFFKKQFKQDNSYLVQAEILRAIGKCGSKEASFFLEKALNIPSPRNVINKAATRGLKELSK
jgi:aminopeptidase N